MSCGSRSSPTRSAWAFDTPFKWTKQVASHFGGTRQGLAISWPNRIKDAGGIRTQFHHIIDIVPTILEATGVQAAEMIDGVKQKPIEGASMVYTFDKANANAPTTHHVQYFEMISNRGIYKEDGWYANTTPPHGPWILNAPLPSPEDYKWELYNLQISNLIARRFGPVCIEFADNGLGVDSNMVYRHVTRFRRDRTR